MALKSRDEHLCLDDYLDVFCRPWSTQRKKGTEVSSKMI